MDALGGSVRQSLSEEEEWNHLTSGGLVFTDADGRSIPLEGSPRDVVGSAAGFDISKFESGIGWCLHCEKAFRAEDFAKRRCPTAGCDGDSWDWSDWREAFGGVLVNQYGESPVPGDEFPLYGPAPATS